MDLPIEKYGLNCFGGTLEIEWNEKDHHVYMTGSATTVFEGEIEEDFKKEEA